MSWRPGRSISPVFYGEPTLSWDNLPYHINNRDKESLLSYKSGKCHFELRKLLFVNHLFIKKVSSNLNYFLKRKKVYKITDNHGIVIFRVVKIAPYFTKFPIQYNFYSEPESNLVLSLSGTYSGLFRRCAILSTKLIKPQGKFHFGQVVQESRFCNPIFSLSDPNGKRSFSIQRPEQRNCWGVAQNAEFNLCHHPDDGRNNEELKIVGKLERNYEVKKADFTKSFAENLDIGTRCKWSIEFPRELDPSQKVLALSGLFLIESKYY